MNTDSNASGRTVSDFSPFCEGNIEPTLNKRIRVLIDADVKYIVYLDDDLAVEWSTVSPFPLTPEFPAIANEVARLESVAEERLRPAQRLPFARLLGEAMARIIGDSDVTKARESLENAAAYLIARSSENARSWHLRAAFGAALATTVALLLLAASRSYVSRLLGVSGTNLSLAALFGPFGALLSILMRFRHLEVEPEAGIFIHVFEGIARVLVGLLGALLVALGVTANLLFGFVNTLPHPELALVAICFVSGASERIVPTFISHLEDQASATRENRQ